MSSLLTLSNNTVECVGVVGDGAAIKIELRRSSAIDESLDQQKEKQNNPMRKENILFNFLFLFQCVSALCLVLSS